MKIGVVITSFGPIDSAIYHNHMSVLLSWKKAFDLEVYHLQDTQQEASLNLMTKAALVDGVDFILYLEHDNLYKKDLLERLLKHDIDIVTGYYPFRNWPYLPIPLLKADNGLLYRFECNKNPNKDEVNLMEMTVGCFGCCLVKASVMKDLFAKGKVFRREYDKKRQVTHTPDIVFFQDIKDCGYKLMCDGNARAGHLTQRLIVDPDNYKVFRKMIMLLSPESVPVDERLSDDRIDEIMEVLMKEEMQDAESCGSL